MAICSSGPGGPDDRSSFNNLPPVPPHRGHLLPPSLSRTFRDSDCDLSPPPPRHVDSPGPPDREFRSPKGGDVNCGIDTDRNRARAVCRAVIIQRAPGLQVCERADGCVCLCGVGKRSGIYCGCVPRCRRSDRERKKGRERRGHVYNYAEIIVRCAPITQPGLRKLITYRVGSTMLCLPPSPLSPSLFLSFTPLPPVLLCHYRE